jgi:hypothetical protein
MRHTATATRPRAAHRTRQDENSAPINRSAPHAASGCAAPSSSFQKFGLSCEECLERFRLWAGDVFFFPAFCDLSDVSVEAGWLPEHLMDDGSSVPFFPQLAELAAGFLSPGSNKVVGVPPVCLCMDGLEAACSDSPPGAVGCVWRPVFRIRYTYCWSPFEAFMAGGGGPVPLVVAVRRPYVYF